MTRQVFSNGADKIFLNSVLFQNKEIIKEVSRWYGNQSIVAGKNIYQENKKYYVLEDRLKKINPLKYAQELEDLGAGEIKVTFVNFEGTKKGMDCVYSKQIKDCVKIPCIFEGGLGTLDHLDIFFHSGLKSLAKGTMIIFSDYNIIKIKQHLKNKNFMVRV